MNTNSTYQQELLRKYIDGSISKNERHLLEKMALDDPFLFDALEGLHIEKEVAGKNIKEISHSFGVSQKKNRRIIPWKWMSIAAGIVLVASIGFLIRPDKQYALNQSMANSKYESNSSAEYIEESKVSDVIAGNLDNENAESNLLKDDSYSNKEEILQEKNGQKSNDITIEEIKPLPSTKIDAIATTSSGISTNDRDSTISIRGSRDKATDIYIDGIRVSKSSIPIEAEIQEITLDTEIKKETTTSNKSGKKDAEITDIKIEEKILDSMPSNAVLTSKTKRKAKGQVKTTTEGRLSESNMANEDAVSMIEIKGKVLDESGEPLIGANVISIDNNQGTTTDIDGHFVLNLAQKEGALNISYTGFTTKYIIMNGSSYYDIIMEEGALLDEIAITNMGSKIHKNKLYNSRPIQGFDYFIEYVQESIILPEGCEGGFVTLSFTINTDGDLENIKVENATFSACESEAIRLLKNGGKWITTPTRQTVNREYTLQMSY